MDQPVKCLQSLNCLILTVCCGKRPNVSSRNQLLLPDTTERFSVFHLSFSQSIILCPAPTVAATAWRVSAIAASVAVVTSCVRTASGAAALTDHIATSIRWRSTHPGWVTVWLLVHRNRGHCVRVCVRASIFVRTISNCTKVKKILSATIYLASQSKKLLLTGQSSQNEFLFQLFCFLI